MKTFKHQATEVQAVQVVKPYAGFKHAFPRHHAFSLPSGRISYFHLVDAVPRSKVYPGDWVVRHEDGTIEVLTDVEFNRRYEEMECSG